MTTTHDDKAREREQFEKAHAGMNFKRSPLRPEQYANPSVQGRWSTWQLARAALSPASTGQEAEREDFEQIMSAKGWLGVEPLTSACWEVWQARSAIAAAVRDAALTEAEDVCLTYAGENWKAYKHGNGPERGNPYVEGHADGADECADKIRALRAAPAQQVEAEIRDKALEEAAKECETRADEHKYGPFWNSQRGVEADACAKAIRALKSAAGSNNGEKA